MDKLVELVSKSSTLQWVMVGFIALITIMIVVLFIQYNIDRYKGRHAKFLWFEVNAVQPQNKPDVETIVPEPRINAKNVNTGNNYGEIGDKYTGLKQRMVTQDDVNFLSNEIKQFSGRYADKINPAHITLGFPGCKETTNLANQITPFLQKMGFENIIRVNLQTHGSLGIKFAISNAPDNSMMIEIRPADNVA